MSCGCCEDSANISFIIYLSSLIIYHSSSYSCLCLYLYLYLLHLIIYHLHSSSSSSSDFAF